MRNSGTKNLLLVLDSNEYIFAFGLFRKPSCEILLDSIFNPVDLFTFFVTKCYYYKILLIIIFRRKLA